MLRIGDLPFHQRPALELLGLTHDLGAATIDVDYTGFGWARVDRLWLTDASSARVPVADALVLGLHSADDSEGLSDDIELEFVLEPGRSVTVLASAFLERWLPRLPITAAGAIVLAMCNPHRARLRSPSLDIAAPATLYHGIGDVDSWLDDSDHDGPSLRLTAAEWCTVVLPGRAS
jgi:hypothetical protein